MPTYQVSAIVIGRTNFGEADRVVRLFTRERGKLGAVARGVRKIKSRSAGHLELFGEVNLVLAQGRGALDVITSARLGWYPHAVAGDYNRLGLAYAFVAIADRVAQEHQPHPELYDHLLAALQVLNDGSASVLLELWYKLRLLELTGYRPELQHCVICGQDSPDMEYRFDAAHGGIVCVICAPATARPMSTSAIKLWRLLCDYPYATVSQVSGGEALALASLAAGDEFYEHHLGRAFRPGFV